MDVRSPERATRPPIAGTELVAIGGLGALALAFFLAPDGVEDGPILCPFRRLTGLPCPGCGLTRSWVYLAHGRWEDAFAAHPFGIVTVLAVVALVAMVVLARVRGRRPPNLNTLARLRWVQVILGAWLAFAAVRLVLAL